jgi:hypothetical protein
MATPLMAADAADISGSLQAAAAAGNNGGSWGMVMPASGAPAAAGGRGALQQQQQQQLQQQMAPTAGTSLQAVASKDMSSKVASAAVDMPDQPQAAAPSNGSSLGAMVPPSPPAAAASGRPSQQQQLQVVAGGAPLTSSSSSGGLYALLQDVLAVAPAGRNISMANLLQQLQSDPCMRSGCAAGCIRELKHSAAQFVDVGLDAIPASLLVPNYIAEVGDRAQRCLSAAGAVGKQDGSGADAASGECLVVMQEVEGLLQLVAQPVLLQLLGGQQWQELVGGLWRCKKLLNAFSTTGKL